MSEPGATILFWMHHRRCGSRGPHLNHRPPVTASTPSSLTPCLGAVPRITGEILSCQCSSRCRRAPPSHSPPSWPTGHRHTWCALHSRKREAFQRPPSSLLPVPAQVSSDYELSREFETELRWDPSSQSVFPRSKVTTRSSPLGRQRRRLNDGREARFATHMPRAASRPPPQCRHRLRQPRLYLTDRPAACPLSQVLPPTFAHMDVKCVQAAAVSPAPRDYD